MLRAEHLFLSSIHKGLQHCVCPPLSPSHPLTSPCQAQLLLVPSLTSSMSSSMKHHVLQIKAHCPSDGLSPFFLIPPCESHPSEVHLPLECLSFWITSDPEMMKGIATVPHFPVSCKQCWKAYFRSECAVRPFPFVMSALEEGLLWAEDTEMVGDLEACPPWMLVRFLHIT